MTNTQAVILGVIQGLTEYLPISSSAHLVIVPKVLSWSISQEEAFVFDILVQLGTLFGVLIYFKDKIFTIIDSIIACIIKKRPFAEEDARFGYLVALATIPAVIVGFFLKDFFFQYFSSPKVTSYHLIVTAALLFLAEIFKPKIEKKLNWSKALLIGFMQCLALFPGISRSGSTISAGMFLGLSRKKAAEFSFFMSMPVMVGASLIAFKDLMASNLADQMLTPIALGFVSALMSGYMVIRWFMRFISHKSLIVFACYCLIIGLFGIWYF